MKICIVIQSEAFRSSAGMRIRYDRFNACLAGSGDSIEAIPFSSLLNSSAFDHDVYIFCKVFETAALLLARRLRAAGKVIGQDLFDDYFSQRSDPRLQRFRSWLQDMAPLTDFVVCSTPRMAEVLRPYFGNLPITVVDDPVLDFDAARITALAQAKVDRARLQREIRLVWFGIGDNPFFPVGIRDLAASEWALAALERSGWNVTLTVVTNKRAFDRGGARALRPLGLGYELVEWSEENEADALKHATVAILPVNGQSFSASKSLNRAVTAIGGGCQVLSLGYDLYERLGAFIYRDPEQLLEDLSKGECLLRPDTAQALTERLQELADPFTAATRFVDAARAASDSVKARDTKMVVCLVHGRSSSIELHKAVSRIRGLSVRSPFCDAPWNYQVRFDLVSQHLIFRVRKDLIERFPVPLRRSKALRIKDHEFVDVDVDQLGIAPLILQSGTPSSYAMDLVRYRRVMDFIKICCGSAFGNVDIVLSDSSPLGIYGRLQLVVDTPVTEPAMGGVAAEHARLREPGFLQHYLTRFRTWSRKRIRRMSGGDVAVIRQSDLFDADWYLLQNPDVAAGNIDPAIHYYHSGWREERDPGPLFSTKLYKRDYPDVAAQDMNPLIHYLEHGQAEGRKAQRSLKVRTKNSRS